jgi:hypothetical protein
LATAYTNLKGTIKWAKVYEPDSFAGAENWALCFYPYDGAEWEKFQKTGLQLKVKDDPDGVSGKFFKLRRPTKKLIRDDLVMFSPPEITGVVNVSYQDPDGNKIRQYNKGEKVTVNRIGDPVELGNGTLVIVNLSYYDTAKGKGHRLENIKVLDLVEYQKAETKTETQASEGEDPKKSEDLNDDLPW